ncbi:hypothetical protein [Psychrobacillus sp. BM2]|uniref:hypothetical protein n=1 Tax=Psychrobacillus sp. BM2 TaxID=3400421 RepID=UPI003B01B6A7
MTIDVLEVFDGAMNVEFKELAYYEETIELPVFTLEEDTVEEWNAKAKKQNIKMFVADTGKQPKDYEEVLSWIYCLIEEEKHEGVA